MKKLLSIIFSLLLLTGCTQNESVSPDNSITTSTESETITTEVQSTAEQITTAIPELSDAEKKLNVTAETKADYIEKYGLESYETAMSSVPIFLQLYNNSNSKIFDSQIEKYTESYITETIEITSTLDGHIIPADYIYKSEKHHDTIIMVHGSGENRRFKEIQMYAEMGYNIISFDERSSGENIAQLATFGVLEHYDLLDVINYADLQISDDKKLIVYGNSMGGAAVGIALGSDTANQKVDYAILDCPSCSMKNMVESGIGRYCKPDEFDEVFKASDEFMSFFLGFTLNNGKVSERIKTTTVPILIFASTADNTVVYEKIQDTYNSISSSKYMYTSETASHCGIYFTESDEYAEAVTKFLNDELT